MTTSELAWAAGFFDGEGSVSAGRYSGCRRIAASISQKTPELLERFQKAVGMGTVGGPYLHKPSGTSAYHWRLTNLAGVETLFGLLFAYLGSVKKAQFRAALEEYNALLKRCPTCGHERISDDSD